MPGGLVALLLAGACCGAAAVEAWDARAVGTAEARLARRAPNLEEPGRTQAVFVLHHEAMADVAALLEVAHSDGPAALQARTALVRIIEAATVKR
jgi:hypothetical protein